MLKNRTEEEWNKRLKMNKSKTNRKQTNSGNNVQNNLMKIKS